MKRQDGRSPDQLRSTRIETDFMPNAEGSALIVMGDTRVICSASVSTIVPQHAQSAGRGWVTAEYAMLPRSTHDRSPRGPGGRSSEIQRLIGRSLRTVVSLEKLAGFCIIVDCDVLQADGGTRCASITGGFVALARAVRGLQVAHKLPRGVLREAVAAVSVGIVEGEPVLDLNYAEDSRAETDLNLVMTGSERLIELQATAEREPFTRLELEAMLDLGGLGIAELLHLQRQALGFDLE